ncbi:MAG: YqaA family protein [Desulfosarcinaceae bacterium]|nr:YqaA family protein [Desulfosarcinaceae bacterium]
MTTSLLLIYGLPGLFVLSFLAATILPLGSEAGVVLLCLEGLDPLHVFWVASVGNTLAAGVNYLVGRWGARLWRQRCPGPPSTARRRAHRRIRRWGAPVLFFAWLPVIGDPLTVAAGGLQIPLGRFFAWVALGKMARYALVIQSALIASGG